jgi:hypothetical protein
MLKKLLIISIIFILSSAYASSITLSEKSSVSLITCSPGEAIYELFGHTSIRVVDAENQLDIVFNYGLFSFDEPNFIGRFVRGKTDYEVGIQGFQDFVMTYAMRNSSVIEQVINFTQEEKQAIWERLSTDILPENKKYRYNFVFNNCATRPRDIIERASTGRVIYPYNISPMTFREAIGVYTKNAKWSKFGFDLCLGMNADKAASETDLHFLPEMLSESLAQTMVQYEENKKEKLTSPTAYIINKANNEDENTASKAAFFTPLKVSWLMFALVLSLTIYGYIKKKKLYFLDATLFFVAGVVGSLLLFLALFSKHPFTDDNFNIVWLNPFWFVPFLLAVIPFPRKKDVLIAFYIAVSVVLTLFILSMWAIPQYFNPAFIPLVLLLLTRVASYVFYWGYKKDKTGKYYTRKKRSTK